MANRARILLPLRLRRSFLAGCAMAVVAILVLGLSASAGLRSRRVLVSAAGQGRIVFYRVQAGASHIDLVSGDGTGLTQLTTGKFTDQDPSWSPDGTRIAFASNRSGRSQVWIMSADGTGLTQLTHRGTNTQPAWSPAGDGIAFISDRTGHNEIWTITVPGSALLQVTNNGATDGFPAWSPDGKNIAFQTDASGPSEIRIVPLSFGLPAAGAIVTYDPAPDTQPSYSPNGRTIAYVDSPAGVGQIWAEDPGPAGNGPTTYTVGPDSDSSPSWSAYGDMLVFSRTTAPGTTGLFEMARGGGSEVPITSVPGARDLRPEWQPMNPAIRAANDMAEKDALQALADAQQWADSHGSYAGMSTVTLPSVDPSLVFQIAASGSPIEVSLYVQSDQEFAASVISTSGVCYQVHNVLGASAGSGTTFASTSTAANCTGTVAMSATALTPTAAGW